jgi:hypothetical protein
VAFVCYCFRLPNRRQCLLSRSPGVYYLQDDKNWIGLQKAAISQTKLSGKGLFVETGGYTSLGTDVICQGANASLRISIPRPTFYVRDVGPSTDVLLIQLTKKRDSRTFHKSSGDATVENKAGARKADIRKTAVTVYPEGTFSITPTIDLKPGEYLLVIGEADAVDFGFDPKKQQTSHRYFLGPVNEIVSIVDISVPL